MKQTRYVIALLALFLLLGTGACSKPAANTADAPAPTESTLSWQEQYDLGLRFLSEGNYQEAIIAFTAAIEIDPKRAEGYNGLADAYLAAGDDTAAMAILQKGWDATFNAELQKRLNELVTASAPNSTEPQPSQTINEWMSFSYALQEKNALSFANIPDLFFESFDGIAPYIGAESFDIRQSKQSGGHSYGSESVQYELDVQDCSYYFKTPSVGVSGYAHAVSPIGSKKILNISIHNSDGLLYGVPIGWQNINLGDSQSVVLDKLGLGLVDLSESEAIILMLFGHGMDSYNTGMARRESVITRGGEKVSTIKVSFYQVWSDSYQVPSWEVGFEFGADGKLDEVLFRNVDYLIELTTGL